jgi:hypothetical protein
MWLVAFCTLVPPVAAQSTQAPADSLWRDFNHYVLIARPDLAAAAGQALLKQSQGVKLLEIVEASDYRDYEPILARAARMAEVREVAAQLGDRLQSARVQESRDAKRIAADIALLTEGRRANQNATERLRAAGQFAAPQLLATLANEAKADLHPYVVTALVNIGRPVVYPLCVALSDLQPATQVQVARVLAEIGYPFALPYLKQAIEDADTDADARRTLQTAFDKLAMNTRGAEGSAAQLFQTLGYNQYAAATGATPEIGYDVHTNTGLVWTYPNNEVGLIPITVPGPIFGDVLAMRSARQALVLDPSLSPALSLWLMANLRRENRMPQGATDPSYPQNMQSAAFYAMLAGPDRSHDVLAQALMDGDAALALDALDILAKTAAAPALIAGANGKQPVLRALTYPDRRVRYSAALSLAQALPQDSFPDSGRVVPVLAEAVRLGSHPVALVLSADQTMGNQLAATLREMGHDTIAGGSLAELGQAINLRAGVDVIVTDQSPDAVVELLARTASDYKLSAAPIIVVTSPGAQIELRQRLGDESRVMAASVSADQLRSAIEQGVQRVAGSAMSSEEAQTYALAAIQTLAHVGLTGNRLFNISDAQPALIAALADERPVIQTAAANALAQLSGSAAQVAIADAAFADAIAPELQVGFLTALADSATRHGNQLTSEQLAALAILVESNQPAIALAAGRAHGALSRPTAAAVERIVK